MTTDTKRPANKNQPRSLMARGIDALSRREYSRKELREKLVQALEAGQSASEVDAVLDELESKKYLSNERYARSRVRMRSARYGNRRLAYELAMKGIDAEEVQEALQEAGDEFERAWAVWSRRYGNPPEDYKEKTRQARFTFTALLQPSRKMATTNHLPNSDFRLTIPLLS